ncbi:hypothetical protein COLO4_19906 [Corchorus olitorius]|uniref:Uncharacterized protein n=1 Tax=Corchorus olitorius TaxID=93759 RepID=A0A1R3J2V5_9ROSI|nr:hypothetical protein COLO4_19906 [Corchorus olitorius]
MMLVEELNYKEVSFEMGSKFDSFDLEENDCKEVTSVEYGLLDNSTIPNDSPMDDKDPATPSTVHPSTCMETSKGLKLECHKKKKKRAKHN